MRNIIGKRWDEIVETERAELLKNITFNESHEKETVDGKTTINFEKFDLGISSITVNVGDNIEIFIATDALIKNKYQIFNEEFDAFQSKLDIKLLQLVCQQELAEFFGTNEYYQMALKKSMKDVSGNNNFNIC